VNDEANHESNKIENISEMIPTEPLFQEEVKPQSSKKKWGALGVVGIALLKFGVKLKFLLIFFKMGKILTTFGSMLLMIVVYAQIYGLAFALGFVALLFCHEMGHYFVAQKLGMNVSTPLFIPFVGAMISLKEQPQTAEIEAQMAMGGPAAGMAASFVCFGIYGLTNIPLFSALAYIGLFMNLFNLIPIHPLDGGRIAVAVTPLLWVIGIPIGTYFAIKFGSIILMLILVLGVIEAYKTYFGKKEDYFKNVPPYTRVRYGVGYLSMVLICGVGMMYIFMNHVPIQ
jgi:Zn-dependent protease